MAACHAKMSDLEIIEAYLKGQATRCFDLLYSRYAGKIYAKCLSMLGDAVQAKDAAQEVFMKIFINLSRFNAKSKFSTWVYSITYNYCIDFIRRDKKQQAIFTDDLERAPDLVEDEVSDKVLLEMEYEQLNHVLQQLQPTERAILLMKYQDGDPIRDIAERFGKTESAIKMQIKRAKERARDMREPTAV